MRFRINDLSVYFFSIILLLVGCDAQKQYPIDRKLVVDRHQILVSEVDSLKTLVLGNGKFSFFADVTGLQSFPEAYQKGLPLATIADWGWYRPINPSNYTIEQTLTKVPSHARKIPFALEGTTVKRQTEAAHFLATSPRKMSLGTIGFEFQKSDSTLATATDLSDIKQVQKLWQGELSSQYTVDGVSVKVSTYADIERDVIAFKVKTKLLQDKRVNLSVRLPSLLGEIALDDSIRSEFMFTQPSEKHLVISYRADSTQYYVYGRSSQEITVLDSTMNQLRIQPDGTSDEVDFVFQFSPTTLTDRLPQFDEVQQNNTNYWEKFWKEGGFVDFSAVEDPRAMELERRMVLSLYQSRIHASGKLPFIEVGQGTAAIGGRPRFDLGWWNTVPHGLWGNPEVLENRMQWYKQHLEKAQIIAERQGFEGVKWEAILGPNGEETPHGNDAYRIWQQPHPIYYAELLYQNYPHDSLLTRYKDVVFQTADYMASFAWLNPETGRYSLEEPIFAAQLNRYEKGVNNPSFELAYWRWGLQVAQQWRERLGLPANVKWAEVASRLVPLPRQGNIYTIAEGAPSDLNDSIYISTSPMRMATLGLLPATDYVNISVMEKTFGTVKSYFKADQGHLSHSLMAMAATRLGKQDEAIEMLCASVNSELYLVNGLYYNNQTGRTSLTSNGAFLTALGLMAAGYGDQTDSPGFPRKWKIKVEGIRPML